MHRFALRLGLPAALLSTSVRHLYSGLWVLLIALAADAQQTYQITTGVWGRSDGPDVDMPFVGRTLYNCDFLVEGHNSDRTAFDTMGTPTMHPGFRVGPAIASGCPSGAGQTLTTTGATALGRGGAFTLPPHALSRPGLGYVLPVTFHDQPNVVQAATSGLWRIPHSTRGTGRDALGASAMGGPQSVGGTMRAPTGCAEASCTNLPPFRRLHRDAWKGGPMSTFNGQTGRVGADFTWCWDNPGCTTINQASAQNRMMVRYKAGPNRFGGTINQIVSTATPGDLAFHVPGVQLVFVPLDDGLGGAQVEGRGYADFRTHVLPAATKAYDMYMLGNVYVPFFMGSLPLITMVTSPEPVLPPFNLPRTVQKYGFPLTTGTVVARHVSPVGPPVVTLTAMGGDSVTSMGARNLSLVAGSLVNGGPLGGKTPAMSHLFMTLPEPGRGVQALAGAAALLGMAAWRARRTRREGRAF